ncbi:MAG: hypothetical protein AVDCRST_MAG20-1840, partial [uncultured Acidimicrobiales bacterium]
GRGRRPHRPAAGPHHRLDPTRQGGPGAPGSETVAPAEPPARRVRSQPAGAGCARPREWRPAGPGGRARRRRAVPHPRLVASDLRAPRRRPAGDERRPLPERAAGPVRPGAAGEPRAEAAPPPRRRRLAAHRGGGRWQGKRRRARGPGHGRRGGTAGVTAGSEGGGRLRPRGRRLGRPRPGGAGTGAAVGADALAGGPPLRPPARRRRSHRLRAPRALRLRCIRAAAPRRRAAPDPLRLRSRGRAVAAPRSRPARRRLRPGVARFRRRHLGVPRCRVRARPRRRRAPPRAGVAGPEGGGAPAGPGPGGPAHRQPAPPGPRRRLGPGPERGGRHRPGGPARLDPAPLDGRCPSRARAAPAGLDRRAAAHPGSGRGPASGGGAGHLAGPGGGGARRGAGVPDRPRRTPRHPVGRRVRRAVLPGHGLRRRACAPHGHPRRTRPAHGRRPARARAERTGQVVAAPETPRPGHLHRGHRRTRPPPDRARRAPRDGRRHPGPGDGLRRRPV